MEKTREDSGRKLPESEDKDKLAGLPVKDSPYMNYNDLEDYKRKAYGTEGHLQPKPGCGGGSTDAPTPSGSAASAGADGSATATINRQGVP